MQQKSQGEEKQIKILYVLEPNLAISYLESSFLTAHAGLTKRGFPTAGERERSMVPIPGKSIFLVKNSFFNKTKAPSAS